MNAHSDQHHHDGDVDWNAMGDVIERRGVVYGPLYAQIIDAAREHKPDPAIIVDAGSGPGVISAALAEAFPPAEVVALDSAPALLERAERRARDAGLAARVHARRGDLPDAFAELNGADIVWLGQSLHHVGDQQGALAAAAGSLAPGGLLVLLEGGLPVRWMPRDIGIGRPGLQSRLDAVTQEWFAAMRASLPGTKQDAEDWPAMLSAAGLTHAATRSFLLDLPAPVSRDVREHIVTTMERYRETADEHLAAADAATVERLLDPEDPAGLRHRPDVFLLDVQTVHFAVKR